MWSRYWMNFSLSLIRSYLTLSKCLYRLNSCWSYFTLFDSYRILLYLSRASPEEVFSCKGSSFSCRAYYKIFDVSSFKSLATPNILDFFVTYWWIWLSFTIFSSKTTILLCRLPIFDYFYWFSIFYLIYFCNNCSLSRFSELSFNALSLASFKTQSNLSLHMSSYLTSYTRSPLTLTSSSLTMASYSYFYNNL
jgi:hypothetical protein